MAEKKPTRRLTAAERRAKDLREEDDWERHARQQSAWGPHQADQRNENFMRGLREHDQAVRNSGSDTSRREATANRRKFIEGARNTRGLHIG